MLNICIRFYDMEFLTTIWWKYRFLLHQHKWRSVENQSLQIFSSSHIKNSQISEYITKINWYTEKLSSLQWRITDSSHKLYLYSQKRLHVKLTSFEWMKDTKTFSEAYFQLLNLELIWYFIQVYFYCIITLRRSEFLLKLTILGINREYSLGTLMRLETFSNFLELTEVW